MGISNTIELLERMRQTLRKYGKTEEDLDLLIDINDKIKDMEITKRTLNDFYGIKNAFASDILTAHIQKNNSELISRCILKQPENSSKTQTWKEFCEEENERRIKDLEKENERLREEIRKTNDNWYSFVAGLFICVMNRGDENESFK